MSQLLTTIRDNHRRLWADLRKVDPPASEQDRRWAEAVRRGCIFFYGTQEVEIGLFGVDWTGAHIAHQEWRAQLNRFFCLPPLAALHEAGEGDDLPGLARQLIEDWIDQHPRTDENAPAAGDNLLNMSIRVGQSTGRGWWPSVARFNCSDAFDDAFLAKMMASSDAQLDCICARLNPQGNWRISQLDTLLYCGLVVPGLDSHLAFAARMLNECFHRQIQPDGAHEEHCPSYHSWMCDVFTSYWRLGRARPELGLKIDAERIIRMWDYLVCSRTGDGDMVPLNDSSRSTKGAAPLAPLLARRAAVLEESGLAPEEWDLERHPSRYFPHAGQVFLRTGWQEDDAVTSFDASRWDGWHSHLGRNGVSLYAAGRYLLPDPGVFSYEASDPFSAYGRSTRAHNTINFGLMNQGEANPDTHTVSIHQDLAVVASDYQGGYYGADFHGNWLTGHRPGIFGTHERVLLWLGAWGSVVWDFCAADQPGQGIGAHWNLPIGPCCVDSAASEPPRAWSCGDGENVLVQILGSDPPVTVRLCEGQHVPALGWRVTGKPAGDYDPSPLVSFETRTEQRWSRTATFLQPFAGSTPPALSVSAFTCRYGRAYGFKIAWPDGRTALVAATPRLANQVGETEQLATDGALVALLLQDQKPQRALVVGGTFLEWQGQTLMDEPRADTHYRSWQ